MTKQLVAEQVEKTPRIKNFPPAHRLALAALSLSMLMPSLGTSIANAGLPTLANTFSATFQQIQWVVLSYLLTITASIVSVGRLGDMIGRRRLLLIGISIFTAASLLSGLSPTLWLLIAARAAQGLGAAIMMALTVALVGETVPKSKTGSAMGLLGTMSAIGTTLGPTLGGLLIATTGWRSIFLINVPLGVLNLVLAHRGLPQDTQAPTTTQTTFDIPGTLLLTLTLTLYALAMTIGRGHFGQLNIALILIALLGVGLFLFTETRVRTPLIRLEIFRNQALTSNLVMSALVSTVMMTNLVVAPFYLSQALGLETALVGLALSAGPFIAALTGVPAGRIVDRFGTKRMTILGLSSLAAGSFALSTVSERFGITAYLAPILFMTAGYALFQAANNTAIMADIHPDQRGVISGLLYLSRNLGLITGASLMGAIFAAATESANIMTASPAAVAAGMRTTFLVATVLVVAGLMTAVWGRVLTRGTER